MMVKTKNQGDDGSSLFLDWGIYYKNEQDPLLSRKDEKLMGSKMKKKRFAPGEARTHGLQIMRLTRCLLRYRGIVSYC